MASPRRPAATSPSPPERTTRVGSAAARLPRAWPESWSALYHAKARVRPASPTVAGSAACSMTRAGPRSRPMALTMPTQAAAPTTHGVEPRTTTAAPAALTRLVATRLRRRPKRSPHRVTARAPSAAPPSPAPET